MNKLMIYPFSRELSEVIRYSEFLRFDEIVPVIPKGVGMNGRDISAYDGGDFCGIGISTEVERAIEAADAVFIDYDQSLYWEDTCVEVAMKAKKLGKRLYVGKNLANKLPGSYEKEVVLDYDSCEKFSEEAYVNMLNIPIPIITVTGVGNFCDKFSVQLMLGKYLLSQGYEVCQIGSKYYSELFGIQPLPKFLFENVSLKIKSKRFNEFLYNEVQKKRYDVAIIGIPGGIMQTNPFAFEECGEYALAISNAIKSDVNILSVYSNNYTEEFLTSLMNICKYKLNFETKYINFSNSDFHLSSADKSSAYITLPTKYAMDNIAKVKVSGATLFSSFNDVQAKSVCEAIISELSKNI